MQLFTIHSVKNRAFTLIELLVVIGVVLLMIVGLTPFVQMTRERAHRINCANNLRQISIGLHTYAVDHNDAFPATLGALYPNYVDDEKAFDCPSSKTIGTHISPDYSYTTGLTETASPKDIIAQDANGNHKKAGKNVLKVNGSVEWASSRR